MARITIMGTEEYALKLSRLGSNEIVKKVIFEGAKIIADKVKSNLAAVLADSDTGQTGDLMRSFGITPIEKDNEGNFSAKIGFDGYDRNGVANQLKARVLESGSSQQNKTPFVRPAVNATKKQAIAKMGQVIDEEVRRMGL